MIKLIMAMDKNRLIGKQGKLPWHVSGDLKHYKETTINHTILMGQVTFVNMPKLLPNRTYWILTNDQAFIDEHPELICLTSIEEVIEKAKTLLNYQPLYNVSQGLEEAVQWYWNN